MALVINRGEGQSFTIGKDIKITIIDFYEANGKQNTHISIAAPKHLQILRDDAIKKQPKGVG